MEYKEDFTETQHSAWHELKDIEKWFAEHDYIPNKIICGEWEVTDQRWIDYKLERNAKRERQDELLAIL